MKKHQHWHEKPPNWMQHGPPPNWQRKRGGGRLFFRFLMLFGMMVLLILGGMGILALLFTRAAGGPDKTALFVWIGGCGLALALPMMAVFIASRAYRSIATPLADVMAAADAVAEGDLTVRVEGNGRHNQFGQLARSFNHMTSELQRADQQRRNLTADVAHELRTPLHIIQGNLEGVLDGVYEPSEEHIEATLYETRTLARLVDDLHTLSQAEAGQLPLQVELVDVTELLADVQTSFSGQAEVKGVALTVSFADKPAQLLVSGDAGRLDQVLSNLIVNALRHTPPDGQIELFAQRLDSMVEITVSDSGIGISEAELPYIFNRFWRGDAARTHTEGVGAGLGLAIAKQLVEAHDGTIAVSSTAGEGTQFTIVLPAA
jgi:two-component system OmpR family sensor kinase/two-component system sensor histidine kinase BaeS